MNFLACELPGVYLIDHMPAADSRGSFTRIFCEANLQGALGHPFIPVQANISRTTAQGTLRGLHYQLPPAAEFKLILPLRGDILDVIVDLRPDQRSYCRHQAVYLSARRGQSLLVPPGCAHGFMSETRDVEVLYLTSAPHTPAAERGLRWNDPAFALSFLTPSLVSDKDRGWPDFAPEGYHDTHQLTEDHLHAQ